MARKPAAKSACIRFAALLVQYLTSGTRPMTAAGEPWTYAAFAAEVPSSRANEYVSPRSVSNWCKGKSLPEEIEPLLRALFGRGDRHAEARAALLEAFQAARSEKNDAVIARTKLDPAGARWVAQGEQLAIDRTARPADSDAAGDPLRQQLQTAVRNMAAELVEPARRLSNSRTWGRLCVTAESFRGVVDGDPLRMPERLGEAYALLLRLGRFLETDTRVQRDSGASDDPLDPDIHGLLTDLVRTAAPWLRGFPTVAAWDDEAGKALVRADLFQPAREFTRIAREQQAISERDAGEMELLAEAADTSDYQGQKAGNRAVGDAKNLMLAAAGVVATSLSGVVVPEFTTRSLLVQRARAMLATAKVQVEAFAATVPDDLSQALRALVKEGQGINLTEQVSSRILEFIPSYNARYKSYLRPEESAQLLQEVLGKYLADSFPLIKVSTAVVLGEQGIEVDIVAEDPRGKIVIAFNFSVRGEKERIKAALSQTDNLLSLKDVVGVIVLVHSYYGRDYKITEINTPSSEGRLFLISTDS